ncbi:hypothetical protein, partial [Mycobacterium avium]
MAITIKMGRSFCILPAGTTSGTSLGGGTLVSTIENCGGGVGLRGGIQGRTLTGCPLLLVAVAARPGVA